MLKRAYKYQCIDSSKAVIVYYIVIAALIVFEAVMLASPADVRGSFSGMEAVTMIFLFVVGLNSFKENFLFQMQNGVTRTMIWISSVLSLFTLALALSMIDTALYWIMKGIAQFANGRIAIYSLIETAFDLNVSVGLFVPLQILFLTFAYALAIAIGLAITMLYYRMNKIAKVIVSVGVPSFFLIGLPILEETVTHGNIAKGMTEVWMWIYGKTVNLYRWTLGNLFITIILLGLCYLMIYRAEVKKA